MDLKDGMRQSRRKGERVEVSRGRVSPKKNWVDFVLGRDTKECGAMGKL